MGTKEEAPQRALQNEGGGEGCKGKGEEVARRGRQPGSKNIARTRIDDLAVDTLRACSRDLGLTEAVTADEMTARIHKASGATAKVPKVNLEALSLDTLKAICAHRGLSDSGGKVEMIESIQSGAATKGGALKGLLCARAC
jgi:hypothetical protein